MVKLSQVMSCMWGEVASGVRLTPPSMWGCNDLLTSPPPSYFIFDHCMYGSVSRVNRGNMYNHVNALRVPQRAGDQAKLRLTVACCCPSACNRMAYNSSPPPWPRGLPSLGQTSPSTWGWSQLGQHRPILLLPLLRWGAGHFSVTPMGIWTMCMLLPSFDNKVAIDHN